ncbi:hypothetical protein [Geobacillus kaustophilus]|uniref:hypothetical protein n=1 Tax=Geobacillus kaustophilus TaxID=1462 RepID=UPI0005192E34|nr:hypothetical protein [Geobacillus kaustophilus]
MNKVVFFAFLTLLFGATFLYETDLIITNTVHTDQTEALDNASKVAIQKAINKGVLRVDEEIEIDPDVAKREFQKSYEENISHHDSRTDRKYEIVTIQPRPALIAVRGEADVESGFKKFDHQQDDKIRSIEKFIVIYEAKYANKQEGGNVN